MNKTTTLTISLITALSFNLAQAAPVCKPLTGYQQASASLMPVSCADPNYKVLAKLNASNRFPDVTYLGFDGSCYVSNDTQAINVVWGSKPLTIKTVSAWTNNFDTFDMPYLFGNGATGTVGTVVTQMSVFNHSGKNIGQIYTKDTINLAKFPVPEDDVVVGGSHFFEGAKGTIKISSSQGSNGIVVIESIGGTLCVTSDPD